MDLSWFSSTPSKKNNVANSQHELPRWRTSPPARIARVIPPPIVCSVYQLPKPELAASILHQRSSTSDDEQRDIEAELQSLLDIQAEQLEKGRQGISDDQTSNGSTTPTVRSTRSGASRQPPRQAKRRLGLKGSRKGIYDGIRALSAVKATGLQELEDEVRRKEGTIELIDNWDLKRARLMEARDNADGSEETQRVQHMRDEADNLQEEINRVEMHLSDLKSRQKKLLHEAASVENAIQAKLATYVSSIDLLDAEIQSYLQSTPLQQQTQDGFMTVWQLPAKRRTIKMVRSQCVESLGDVLRKREHTESEQQALIDGAKLWQDTVAKVSNFERRLKDEMSKLSGPVVSSPEASTQSLQDLLQHLHPVLTQLETNYDLATSKDWRLLIAAIGAELDALKQGQKILRGLAGLEDPSTELGDDDATIRELNQNFEMTLPLDEKSNVESSPSSEGQTPPRIFMAQKDYEDEEDDDPSPELMFSGHHQPAYTRSYNSFNAGTEADDIAKSSRIGRSSASVFADTAEATTNNLTASNSNSFVENRAAYNLKMKTKAEAEEAEVKA